MGLFTPATDVKVKAYWVPEAPNVSYDVGRTGVSIAINTNNLSQNAFTFYPGDSIRIKNDGLLLDADDKSKLVASNITSINKYGKHEYTTTDNRFMKRVTADTLCKNIVYDYKDPKYILNMVTTLDPTLAIVSNKRVVNAVTVRCKEFFPKSDGYQQLCKIRGITHNFRNFTTALVLKSTTAY